MPESTGRELGVATMNQMNQSCAGMESKLADLMLDPSSVPAKVQSHVAQCADCGRRLAELKATMALLDTWEAPEPNPYFLTRFEARMRDERQSAPAGWLARQFARLHAGFAYGPGIHVRPLAAMALTVFLLVGGGTYLDLTDWNHPVQQQNEADVVHDLQGLANNAQLLDQMEALSTNDNGD
jgi:hypothetical protein